jgi:Rieske 2Fe-2S family protein
MGPSQEVRHPIDASSPRLRLTQPARVYTDPEWFAAEMERIFASMWIAAGRADQMPEPGDFVRRDVADASVLIVRDRRGGFRAFHNVCRHRGTELCEQAAGRFPGSIQCPYHAWTYDLDGTLIGAPLMDHVEGFSRGDYPLHPIACEVWDGHIFINLSSSAALSAVAPGSEVDASSAKAEPLSTQLGDLPARFARWHMADLRFVHRIQYDVRANWKLIVQNYNECLHCPVIHPLLNRMHHYLGADNVPSTETYCGGAMGFNEGVETLSTDGRLRRAYLPGLSSEQRRIVSYYAIYPNLLLTLHPDYMTTVTIWPHAPNRTTLVAEWHFHADEIARPGFVWEDAVEFWDRTNREDWAISERAQRGISSRGYTPGPYSGREGQLWDFDRFVESRVTDSH